MKSPAKKEKKKPKKSKPAAEAQSGRTAAQQAKSGATETE